MTGNMEINKALNIVLTVEGASGPMHIHAVPLSEIAFKHHFRLISKVYSVITAEQLLAAGPRIAALLAVEEAEKQGNPKAAEMFLAELRRSASVFVQQGDNWHPRPLQLAVDGNLLDDEAQSEVENLLAFFTSYSAMLPRSSRASFAVGLMSACDGRTTSLTSTEYAVSLRTLTMAANSSEKVA